MGLTVSTLQLHSSPVSRSSHDTGRQSGTVEQQLPAGPPNRNFCFFPARDVHASRHRNFCFSVTYEQLDMLLFYESRITQIAAAYLVP